MLKINLLQNPLSKGESWEQKSKREIEVTKSSDNRGAKPTVYFSICKEKGNKKQMQIVEDLFIPTDVAIQLGKQLIKQAKTIDKEYEKKNKVIKHIKSKIKNGN